MTRSFIGASIWTLFVFGSGFIVGSVGHDIIWRVMSMLDIYQSVCCTGVPC